MKRFWVLLVIALAFFAPQAAAQQVSTQSVLKSSASAQEDAPNVTSMDDYTLPYPGILPDNPLYILKTVRDRLVGMLISDPVKKSAFDLLQADKRLQSGIYLIDKSKNYLLAETTISKGENYFEDALSRISDAKKQGMDVNTIESNLANAAKKHQQVILGLLKKAPKQYANSYKFLLMRMDKLEKETNALVQ
jgi:hypothetical protein